MVSIFQKKAFLPDLLEDFVDMHNHILPGIDDGAKTVEESLDMLYAFQEIGINQVITTPHVYKELYPNTTDTIREAHLTLLESLAGMQDLNIKLDFAAEHMVDDHLEQLLQSAEFLPLGKAYILIEMPFLQASLNMPRIVELCKEQNVFPILAHPERYRYMHKNRGAYARYREMGLFFQVNLLSITGYYGKSIQQTAMELIQSGKVEFLGSDAHRVEEIDRIKNCQVPLKLEGQLEKAFRMNEETFYH